MELGNMIIDAAGNLELQMEQILLHAVYNYISGLEQPKKPTAFVLTPHDFELLYRQASETTDMHRESNGSYYWYDILISADARLKDGTMMLMI